MMASLPQLNDLANNLGELNGKYGLVRLDLNVPMKDGVVGDPTRIERVLPTLTHLLECGAKLALISHLGRPKGKQVAELSLAPLTIELEQRLQKPVGFHSDLSTLNAHSLFDKAPVVLIENLRFEAGEEANDPAFAQILANGFDFYVNDAFSCAHRAHASVHAITNYLPSYAGLNLAAEVTALTQALEQPKRPVMAIIGGAKISTKIPVLENLLSKLDYMVIGGGMANTFLAANSVQVGKSLCEYDWLETARKIQAQAKAARCEILLPLDVSVAKEVAPNAQNRIVTLDRIEADDLILDIGDQTIQHLKEKLSNCTTLLWNGPVGVFEMPPFDLGTNALARHAASLHRENKLVSVAGGGDTVAALNHALNTQNNPLEVETGFSYISTAGGAFLEWLEGRELPGISVLMKP